MDSLKSLSSSALRFFSGTLLSRLAGFGREVLMATFFGATPSVAAFWMAFRFAYILRRIFGEGALNVAFIPHFEALRREEPLRANQFFYNLSSGLILLLLLIIGVTECILGYFLFFSTLSETNREVIRLTMVMLPALLFISLYALNSSFLNCERVFFLPSVAPFFLNLIWIGAILTLSHLASDRAMLLLAMTLTFAFTLQWGITLPKTIHSLKQGVQKGSSIQELLSLLRPFFLCVIGVTATQLNTLFDAIFARVASLEGPAYLWYAMRLQQLPLALFGVTLSGVVLPPIARAYQNGDIAACRHYVSFGINQLLVWMIPMTAGMLVLGFSGVALLYGHGQFTNQAIQKTTHCLWGYAAGLLPTSCVLIFSSLFYARKDYKTPMCFSVLSVIVNICLNTFFVFVLGRGAESIAFSTSIAAIVNCGGLAYVLHKEKAFNFSEQGVLFVKISLCALIAMFGVIMLNGFFSLDMRAVSGSLFTQFLIFGSKSICFLLILFLAAYVFKVRQLITMFVQPFRSSQLTKI